ncbi:universal stress protein [Streptacidiphilus jiangxiensis]|uniref:Nucleotide-binding universal stress protein, UspA family n=1 Tax=Streptacidiphilus jiangxiensis TaxID=235985 RepID=A0A1H7QW19_STRJI|nr:universal stress protein [Streptacidiphilus jiangxiensis]SEL51918.1 Nucleotide-binding universal stress protein, UspA family [Streptacidiphilus jiangxiensis]
MTTAPSGSVVVGVDQSAGARAALEWAAAEAQRRAAALRIACSWNSLDHELPEDYQQLMQEPAQQATAGFLSETATELRARYPDLDIGTVTMAETPAEGLIALAGAADLLVVGRRGLNTLLTVLLGSVSQQVVAHSPVPVVVVPETPAPAAPEAPVVVGVAREVTEPLAFAFAEAELRGAPLIAVRSWALANPYVVASPEAVTEIEADEDRELRSLVDVVHRRHPSVEVGTRVEFATAEAALIEAAKGAGLVVLGRHRRHMRYGLPLGRVPHRVLHLSDLPVVVVPN